MGEFETFFELKLSHQIFAPAEQCSTNIQAVDITVQKTMKGANLLVSHLHSLQKESMFDHFYGWAIEESKSFTEEPKLPIKKAKITLQIGPWILCSSSAFKS